VERAIEIFAALSLTVIGLSHVAQPRVWVEFFIWLREKGLAGVFAVVFLNLNFGALIVAFHNVWHGLPMIFTIIGWGQVLKGALYFVAPQIGMRALRRVSPERSWEFVAGGAILLALCPVLWYVALAR
jgi:CDP-diglyceride synthetase